MLVSAALFEVCVAGCGARTGLEVDGYELDAAGLDAGVDGCRGDDACDDGIACTVDRCVAARCVHDGRDALCTDDRFCTTAERCDVTRGCVADTVVCDDARTCTADTCDDSLGACRFTATSSCPIVAHDPDTVFELDVAGGESRLLSNVTMSSPITDLAYAPDGTLYAATWPAFGRIDLATGRFTSLVPVVGDLTAVVVTDDGTIYGGSASGILRLDPAAGTSVIVAPISPGLRGYGDLEIVEGRLHATSFQWSGPDLLLEIDVVSGETRIVGELGIECIWGLAVVDRQLYGVSCDTSLYRIDVSTGLASPVRSIGFMGWGASAQR